MGNVKTLKKTRKKKYRKKEIKTMKKNIGGGLGRIVAKGIGKVSKSGVKSAAKSEVKSAAKSDVKSAAKSEVKKEAGKSGQGLKSKLEGKAKDKMNQKMNEKKEELTNKVTDKISGKSGSDKEEEPQSNTEKYNEITEITKGVEMTSGTVTARSPGESPKQRLSKIMKKAKELDASCMKIISDAHESGDWHMSTKEKLELAAVVVAGTALELTGVGAGAGLALEGAEGAALAGEAVEGAALAGEAVEGAEVVGEAGELAEGAEAAEGSAGRRAAKKALDNVGNNDDDEDPTKNIKIQDPHKMLKKFKPHLPKKIYKRLVNCIRQSNNLKKDAIETYRALKNKNKMTCNPKQKNPKACGGKGCPDCGDVTCFCPRSATKADQMIEGMQNLMKTTKGPLPYIFLLITKILLKKIK